jgi:hypothetical protein
MEDFHDIIKEEIIRDEVRRILATSGGKRKHKLFEFFNSAVGIFILTTVFVTFSSWLFSTFSSYRESLAAREKILYQLSTEISYRLDLIKEMNGPGMLESEYFNLLAAYFGFDGERKQMDYYLFKSMFKEFENRTLHSLIIEYNFVSKQKDEALLEIAKAFPYFERSMSYRVSGKKINDQRLYKMPKADSVLFEEKIKVKIQAWSRKRFAE